MRCIVLEFDDAAVLEVLLTKVVFVVGEVKEPVLEITVEEIVEEDELVAVVELFVLDVLEVAGELLDVKPDPGRSVIDMSSTYMYAPLELPAVARLRLVTACWFNQKAHIQLPFGSVSGNLGFRGVSRSGAPPGRPLGPVTHEGLFPSIVKS